MAADRQGRFGYLPGLIFFLGSGSLIYEVGLLREIRFQLVSTWISHLFFTAVLCLIGLGAILVHVWKGDPEKLLRRSLLALVVLAYPCFLLTIKVIQLVRPALPVAGQQVFVDTAVTWSWLGVVQAFGAAMVAGFGVMFVLHGMVFTLIMRRSRRTGVVPPVYGADLVGAGLGALMAAAASFWLDPGQLVALSALLLSGTLLVTRSTLEIRDRSLVLGVSGPILATVVAFGTTWNLEFETREAWKGRPIMTAWSPYQRVDVIHPPGGSAGLYVDNLFYYMVPNPALGWISDDTDRPFQHLVLATPGGAAADDDPKDVLIIGSGLGRDVVSLRATERAIRPRRPPTNVTAVELDRAVVGLAEEIPWIWSDYGTADVRVGEGRNFLIHTDEKYDVIHYAYLDKKAHVSVVLLADAMFLYTAEALRTARGRLTPRGYFIAKRVVPSDIRHEVARRAVATLEEAGVDERSGLVALSRSSFHVPGTEFHTMYMVFGAGEIPREERADLLRRLDVEGIDVQPWDGGELGPTTDQFPFSLHDGRTVVSQFRGWIEARPAATIALTAALLLVVLACCRRRGHAQMFTIGVGFMLLESVVLVQSFLVLGNPSLSTGVALGAFLVGTGIGSLAAPSFNRRPSLAFVSPVVVLAAALLLPWVLESLVPHSIPVRAAGFVLWVLPLAISVGAFFPLSLDAYPENPVPGLLLVNLLGNAAAPLLFQLLFSSYGYYPLTLAAAALYAVAALLLAPRLALRH